MTVLSLPAPDGAVRRYRMHEPATFTPPREPLHSRVLYAAAHVVGRADGDNAPGEPADLDWDATLEFRAYLGSWGLGVAEAMDTAQRGMGLDWPATRELMRRSGNAARDGGYRLVGGAGTDQLGDPVANLTLDDVVHAYEEQLAVVTDAGAVPVLLASRHLAAVACTASDYVDVYGRLLAQLREPVILHWLGPVFDPSLAGYWGAADPDEAAATLLAIIADHTGTVDGVKVSLLDPDRERSLRAALPAGVTLYTGDDFHYPELIRGDGRRYSDALLGALAIIAPAASAAVQALDRGDVEAYDARMASTLAMSRHVFCAPTRYYKTGVAFVSWLAGRQPGFTMVGGLQSARSTRHLVQTFRLVDAAGLLPDAELAARRMTVFLTVAGVLT
ncbi:MAG: DUF993 family protein [Mycobacteriales bacterium]